ncbi:hypothetical protein TIFTF001_056434 [Ficus carica]|uniref:Uncharacterized protein n=1 Tax=Ficus carica TaxID=3494 RepID=A0AA88EQ43_FICCA|nr:hypothetical protein TIFTF001_056434 [Ficus carica]
MWDGHRHKF